MEMILALVIGVPVALLILWAARGAFGKPTASGAPNATAPEGAPDRSPGDVSSAKPSRHTHERRHVED